MLIGRKITKVASIGKGAGVSVKMGFWFLVCSFLQKGIGMITIPIFTRIMLEEEFGRYQLFLTWSSFFIALFSLNLDGEFYMRGITINESDKYGFTSSMIGLLSVSCAAGLCFYLAFSRYFIRITKLSNYLVLLIFVQMFFVAVRNMWYNMSRFDYRYQKVIAVTLLLSVLNPIISIIFVRNSQPGKQVEARVTATILIDVLLCLALLVYFLRHSRKLYNGKYWRSAFLFALPLIPHYFSKIILNNSDRIMIEHFGNASQVGYYSLAYSLASVVMIFNGAVSTTLTPWLYKSIKAKSFPRIKTISLAILAVMAAFNLVVITFAPEALRILAPANYFSAVWVVPPVTASTFFMFMYDLFARFQFYFAKTKWVMAITMVGAVLNIVLNAIFIPLFGFVAAGYTTLVCFIIYGALHYVCMRRVCKEYLGGVEVYAGKKIFLLSVALLVLVGGITLVYDHIAIRYSVLLALAIGAFASRKKLSALFSEIRSQSTDVD